MMDEAAGKQTINAARAVFGHGPLTKPDGEIDPDGDLTLDQYLTKKYGNGTGKRPATAEGAKP